MLGQISFPISNTIMYREFGCNTLLYVSSLRIFPIVQFPLHFKNGHENDRRNEL